MQLTLALGEQKELNMKRSKCVHGYKCEIEFCPLEDESCIGFTCDDLEYKNKKKTNKESEYKK